MDPDLDLDLDLNLDLGSNVYDWIDDGFDLGHDNEADADADGDVKMKEEKAESSQQKHKQKQQQQQQLNSTKTDETKEEEFEEIIIPPMPKELVSRVHRTFGPTKGSAFQVNALTALRVDVLVQTEVVEKRSLAGPQKLTHVFWPDKHRFIMTRLSRSK